MMLLLCLVFVVWINGIENPKLKGTGLQIPTSRFMFINVSGHFSSLAESIK
jgi:hypothetical protein